MKSNLKKILSMVLVLVIFAVNLAFTVSAAEYDITVDVTDLEVAKEEGQGVGFFETSPESTDQDFYSEDYSPFEVNATNMYLAMNISEWVKYKVEAPEAGVYSVSLQYATNRRTNVLTIRNDVSYTEANLESTRNSTAWTVGDFGYLYLSAGENDIYVDNKGTTEFNLKTLYLTKVAEPDYKALKTYIPSTACNEIENLEVDTAEGYNKIEAGGATLTFPFKVYADGKYKITVRGKAGAEDAVSVSVDSGTAKTAAVTADGYLDVDAGVFAMNAGMHTLSFSVTRSYKLAHIAVEYVAPIETVLTSETVNNGDTIARGTDKFVFTLNADFAEVTTDNVKIETEEGSIDVAPETDGKTLNVYLLETLDYETTYTLTLTGIKGEYDETALGTVVITFTTSDTEGDVGEDALAECSAENVYEEVTVSGTVLSGAGKGISGRTVIVKDSEDAEVATAVSGENGAFEANFTIAEGTAAGVYEYTVETDYAATETLTVTYMSQADETACLAEFKTAATAAAVKAIFDSNSSNLGITTYADDIDELDDPTGMESVTGDDLFYNHFINQTFADTNALRTYYEGAVALEKLNQCRVRTQVKNMITDEENCKKIGLNYDRVSLLKTQIDAFTREYYRQEISLSREAFMERFNTLLDKCLKTEFNITDVTLDLAEATAEAYVAQGIIIPLKATAMQKNVASIEMTVTATDAAIAESAVYEGEDATAEITTEEGTTTIKITFETPKSGDSFGEISLTASTSGGYTIAIAGTATYQLSETETIDTAVISADHAVTIKSAPGKNNRPSSSSGSGSSKPSVNKPAEDTNPDDTETPVETKKGYFDDIADAKWAETMINTLTDKGILSENVERKFRPNDNITREEYVKMIVMVIGSHDENAKADFGDVADGHWANSYLATAANLGIVKGDTNNNFGLGQNITRQDMAVIIYRVFEMLKISVNADAANFSDGAEIAGYAKTAVDSLVSLGVINGMGDNTFAPKANATRAQAAKVIYTMMEVLGI